MSKPLIHIISSKHANLELVAAAAREIDPTTIIESYISVTEFFNRRNRSSDAFAEILVTEFDRSIVLSRSGRFLMPIIQFSTLRMEQMSPDSSKDVVFIGEIKDRLIEEIATARFYLKLKTRVPMLSKLNTREKKIVWMAAEGVPNKTIARRLNVSIKTVELCRRNAYSKLSIKSTAEVASLVTFGKFFCDTHMPTAFEQATA